MPELQGVRRKVIEGMRDGRFQRAVIRAGTIPGVADESSSTTKRLVFVSHCGLDTWVAKQIARAIEARGATPFLDEAQVDAGADFEEDILDFLAASTRTGGAAYALGFGKALCLGRDRGRVGPAHTDRGAIARDHGDGVANASGHTRAAQEAIFSS
jgi:hypothetical protein